jgi:hypothetical protein
LQHLGVAAHGQHFRRPEGIEALALHLRPAYAMELASGRCRRKRGDQVRAKLVAGGLAGHHGNAHHQRMMPRPGHPRKLASRPVQANGCRVRADAARASSSFMPLLYSVLKARLTAATASRETAALEAFGIDAARLGRIAGGGDERRQILQQDGAHRRETVGADAHELMDHGEAAEDGPIANLDMACQLGVVGEDGLVADLAIVRQMHIGHDPVVVAQASDAGILRRAAIEGAELADRVAVADLEPGRLAGILLVLRGFTDRAELEDAIVAADAGMSGQHHMRTDHSAIANLDMLAHDRIRADHDATPKSRRGMDDGCRMNAHCGVGRTAQIRSASEPPGHRPWPRRELPDAALVRRQVTSITNWSPGPTGRLKRALSMPTK